MKLFGDEYARLVISRYTSRSVKFSIYRDILDLLEQFGLTQYVEITGDEIRCKLNGNMIITHSMRLSDGTMSAKGKGLASVTHLIIDEAQELPSEEEYIKVIDTFRVKGVERKIFVVFNPGSKRHWLFKRFFIGSVHQPNPKWLPTHLFIHTTYKDNLENLDPTKVAEWDLASLTDPKYYEHHLLGEFTDGAEGQVYTDFKVGVPDPQVDYEVTYGLDWGFSSDPTALVKVWKHNDKVYVKELIYDRGLTIPDLAKRMSLLGITKRDQIIADSAEPRSIEELRRLGFTVSPSYKGPDSIRSGIEKIKSLTVFVDPTSDNLLNEVDLYSWNDATGRPIDKWNHALDSLRYALNSKTATGEYGFAGPSSSSKVNYKNDLSKRLY
jgi:phage terminase large subunit